MSEVKELLNVAFILAMNVSHSEITPKGHWFTWRELKGISSEKADTITAWADGLMHKYYYEKCMDDAPFIVAVTRDIKMMKEVLAGVGVPVRLTAKEITRRGYRN